MTWWCLVLAVAEGVGPVRVSGCDGVSAETVERLLRLELRSTPSDAVLLATCRGDQVELELQTVSAGSVTRALTTGNHGPRVLERLIALAGAELVTSAATPPPPAEEAVATPTVEVPATRSSFALARVDAAATARGFVAGRLVVWGAQVGGQVRIVGPFSVSVLGQVEQGTAQTRLGPVSATMVSGAVAAQVVELLPRSLELDQSLGVSLGSVRLQGHALDAATTQSAALASFWWSPRLRAGLTWRFLERGHVRVGVEGGWALGGVIGEVPREAPVSAAGGWVAAVVGGGYEWP